MKINDWDEDIVAETRRLRKESLHRLMAPVVTNYKIISPSIRDLGYTHHWCMRWCLRDGTRNHWRKRLDRDQRAARHFNCGKTRWPP